MDYTQIGFLVIVILAICEASKYAGLNTRWVPLLSVLLGIAGSLWFGGINWLATLAGVITGLATSGGYKLVKKSILGK